MNVSKMHKGKGGDSKSCDIFESMGQGSMGKHKVAGGLFRWMHQGALKGTPGRPRPGKSAPSIARRMGQGGK